MSRTSSVGGGGAEREFGVPFPGFVLPHARWTRTGMRDDGRPFDWTRTFGRAAPRVVDLGCGNGRYLIGSALARPERDHLGIDTVQRVVDYAAHRANQRGLTNVRFVTADAVTWLFERIDTAHEIHVYHPQPYYEPGEIGKRMLTPEFLERAWRVLHPGGTFVLQTDNKAYWAYLSAAMPKWFDVDVLRDAWPDSPRTRREIIARQKGLTIWRMVGHRRDRPREMAVPRPNFDANRPGFRRRTMDS